MYFNIIIISHSHSHSLKSKGAKKPSFDASKWYIYSLYIKYREVKTIKAIEDGKWEEMLRKKWDIIKYFIKNYFPSADGEWKCHHYDFTQNCYLPIGICVTHFNKIQMCTMETANAYCNTHQHRHRNN